MWINHNMVSSSDGVTKDLPKAPFFFLINNTSCIFQICLYTWIGHWCFRVTGPLQVKHYHIKENCQGQYYLSEKHPQTSVKELINYHKHNAGGMLSTYPFYARERIALFYVVAVNPITVANNLKYFVVLVQQMLFGKLLYCDAVFSALTCSVFCFFQYMYLDVAKLFSNRNFR